MNPEYLMQDGNDDQEWILTLYVAGSSPKSLAAVSNLRRICETHLDGRYQIEVIDLMTHPELAQKHQILAIPTLVRRVPAPVRKVIGDLSNHEKALLGIDLKPQEAA